MMNTMKKKIISPSSSLPYTLLILTLAVSLCGTSMLRCPDGYYRDGHSHGCQACSTCPVNQIIRRPCTEDSNTLCGPFTEFLEFHQAPRPSLDMIEEDDLLPGGEGPPPGVGATRTGDTRGSDDNRSRKLHDGQFRGGDPNRSQHPKHKHHRGNGHRPRKGEENEAAEDLPWTGREGSQGGGSDPAPRSGPSGQPEAPSLQDPEEGQNQWKVLALALIVVLCVVCIFLIVFVFVICYMRSRRAHLKQVLYSAENAGSNSNSGGRGPRADHRPPFQSLHYVPVLTHAQPRAGTSGGAMVAAPPGGLVPDSSYLYSEEYDADNSGQTISTTKSSDYVYFKSPHNGNDVVDV